MKLLIIMASESNLDENCPCTLLPNVLVSRVKSKDVFIPEHYMFISVMQCCILNRLSLSVLCVSFCEKLSHCE